MKMKWNKKKKMNLIKMMTKTTKTSLTTLPTTNGTNEINETIIFISLLVIFTKIFYRIIDRLLTSEVVTSCLCLR